MHTRFTTELIKIIIENLFNDYTDNHNIYRFGPAKPEIKNNSIKSIIKRKLNKKKYFSVPPPIEQAIKALDKFAHQIDYFEYLYNLIEDDYSRDLLIKICAFRILGKRKIKLPMNNPGFWEKVAYIEKNLADKNDFIKTTNTWLNDYYLYKHNVNELGYPVSMYLKSISVYYTFVYKCYYYRQNGVDISVKPGDYVIDAGACYGDVAFSYAHDAGPSGKVYSIEFMPDNLDIFHKNIALNPELSKRIQILETPIWSKPGVPVYFEKTYGISTKVSMERMNNDDNVINTSTIDQLVANGTIEKVDFISMDIEGAEVEALKGAENTLRKFKPKLAISLYHRPSDFRDIPEYIKSLNLGYKFYFNHFTMHIEESVLFCIA